MSLSLALVQTQILLPTKKFFLSETAFPELAKAVISALGKDWQDYLLTVNKFGAKSKVQGFENDYERDAFFWKHRLAVRECLKVRAGAEDQHPAVFAANLPAMKTADCPGVKVNGVSASPVVSEDEIGEAIYGAKDKDGHVGNRAPAVLAMWAVCVVAAQYAALAVGEY